MCRGCGNECFDKPTEHSPVNVQCPMCNGSGCQHCDKGTFLVTDCFGTYCRELTHAIALADFSERGPMPLLAGSLEQSAWFVNFVSALQCQDAIAKAEAMK